MTKWQKIKMDKIEGLQNKKVGEIGQNWKFNKIENWKKKKNWSFEKNVYSLKSDKIKKIIENNWKFEKNLKKKCIFAINWTK